MIDYKIYVVKKLLLFVGAITIFSIVAISLGSFYLSDLVKQSENELIKLENKRRALSSEVRFLLDQYRIFKKFGDEFYDLEKRKLVGEVRRIKWIDNFLLFSYVYHFKDVTAVLLPQIRINKGYVGDIPIKKGNFYINPIRFSASIPSDVDFFRFLDFVNNEISSFYFINSCLLLDKRIVDLYNIDKDFIGLFSYNEKKELERSISIRCIFNIITSKFSRDGSVGDGLSH